jgi:hypothetical protein
VSERELKLYMSAVLKLRGPLHALTRMGSEAMVPKREQENLSESVLLAWLGRQLEATTILSFKESR